MVRSAALALLFTAASAQPPSSGSSSSQNVHVTFGAVSDCIAPPDGNCGDFSISTADFDASLTDFKAGSSVASTFNYYGDWWSSNVGTDASVSSTYCDAGNPATATAVSYPGVSYVENTNDWTLTHYNAANHDVEDYCSAVGATTPPLMGSTFTSAQTKTFARADGSAAGAISTKSRADVANNVGVAVNGVVIFSPFTGIGTVAPYDEQLDTCNGHPANGEYHYHGYTPCLHGEAVTSTPSAHSKIYGWAYDGFPIYGPYGYTDGNDASSAITRVTSGYVCDGCTDTDKTTASNWAYDASGMLDDCNGRWTKTPEFPNGMYVYVLNIEESGKPTFPGVPYCVQSYDASVTSTAADPSPSPPPPAPPYPPGEAPTPSPPTPPPTSAGPSLPPPDAPLGGGICDVPEGEEGFDSLPGDCKGLIIGCVVGGIVLCCSCGLVVFMMSKKKKGFTGPATTSVTST